MLRKFPLPAMVSIVDSGYSYYRFYRVYSFYRAYSIYSIYSIYRFYPSICSMSRCLRMQRVALPSGV